MRLQGAELPSTGLGCHLAVTQQQQGHAASFSKFRSLLQPREPTEDLEISSGQPTLAPAGTSLKPKGGSAAEGEL